MTAIATPPPPAPIVTEPRLFRAAVLVIGAHVADDSFLQPPAGTGPADHLAGGLVPLALLAVAAWAYPRLRGPLRGALGLALGVLGAAGGIEAYYYTREVGPSGDDFTGLLSLGAAAVLLGLGAATLWRKRRTDGRLLWRYPRRMLLGAAALVVAVTVVWPVGLGYVTTHVGRAVVPPDRLGVPHENVTLTTSDGLRLRGWYVPSRNGAAVIAFPGRNGPQRQARMLARHGYGVLLFDRRGEGASEGAPHAFGWDGDRDVEAAVRFLRGRRDVDPRRIGGIGLSVGGEMMIEAAAKHPELRAVVSEGAGARSFAEEKDYDGVHGFDKVASSVLEAVKTASIAVFADQSPPPHLAALARRIAPRPLLLIAAPNSRHGEELNRDYHAAAGPTSTLWEIPESRHVDGIAARPAEYERRVVGFFDRALRP